MNFNNKKGIMGVLLVLSILCSGAISLVTYQTKPRIQRNEEIRRLGIILDVLQIKYDPKNIDDIVSTYKNRVTETEQNGMKIFKEKETGATALSLSGSGFQSIINVIVALKGDTISGFKVVSQNETPGLGARMSEKAFQSSFIGKKVSGGITWVKTGNAGPSEFDAITGATESSKALTRILNRGFSMFFGETSAPAIPKGMEVRIEMSVLNMFGGNYSIQDSVAIHKNFGESVAESDVKGIKTYKDKKSGATALLVSGSGYQSTIIGLVGLKDDTISTFRIVSQNETSGLGSRIGEDSFLKQFAGKKVSGGIKMVKTGKAGPTEFDAITRSTVSSEAVERMLNKGFAAHYNVQLAQAPEASGEAAKTEAPAAQESAQAGGNAPLSAEMRRMAAVLDVFGIAYSTQDSLAVSKTYQERITEGNEKGVKVFRDKVSGARALSLSGKGFQDTITLAVALKGNTISRLRVVSQNETQGMGTRITEDSFQNQFSGKNVAHGITLVKTGKAGPSEFDALTGATVSSEAVARILNEGFVKYLDIKAEPAAAKTEEAPKTEEAVKPQPAAPPKTEGNAPTASQAPAQSEAGAEKTHDGKLMAAVLDVFGISYAAQDNDAISKTFGARITESEEKGLTIFRDKESGASALVLSGKGFQDIVTIAVALKGDTVSGFKVVSSNETAGFGERIKEDAFQKQFIGKKVSQGISLVKGGKAGPDGFDALTGATITSEAVAKMLDNGFKTYFSTVK